MYGEGSMSPPPPYHLYYSLSLTSLSLLEGILTKMTKKMKMKREREKERKKEREKEREKEKNKRQKERHHDFQKILVFLKTILQILSILVD
jgi:predicted histidine transporter YuiF (NhaC family)